MKYFLAFDTRNYYSNGNRYIVIPNNLVNDNLDVNNNLKALCSFTCKFENETELKKNIIRLIPYFREYGELNLVLMWSREVDGVKKDFTSRVLYSNASRYFDIEYLADVIASKLQSRDFLTRFFNQYKDLGYLNRYLDSLYNAAIRKDIQETKRVTRIFLNRLLFGKTGLEYAKLYKLIVSILDGNSHSKGVLPDSSISDIEFDDERENSSLPEVEEFEFGWLERRARLRQLGKW